MSEDARPKVLMIAYACNPEGTGEHWLGWGWAEQAAKSFQVHLVTTLNAQGAVERGCQTHGLTPHFVALPRWIHTWTNRAGRFGAWLRKMVWAYRANQFCRALHGVEKFALVHQTTFHTFRVPFLATALGIPSVWGPLAGGESIPTGFSRFIGPIFLPEPVRRLFNAFWFALPPVQRALKRADVLFVSNHTTLDFLGPALAEKSVVVPPNAIRPQDENRPVRRSERTDGVFRLLYVGNCLPTRAMPIAFAALARAKIPNCELVVIGSGAGFQFWQEQARKWRVEDRVRFLGQLPHAQLVHYYENSDALVFPALRDSGGSALLEAMSKGLPVICLDWAGPAEMVDAESGIKVEVSTPEKTIQDFADALVRLQRDPALGRRLAERAVERTRRLFTWQAKRALLEQTYQRLLAAR